MLGSVSRWQIQDSLLRQPGLGIEPPDLSTVFLVRAAVCPENGQWLSPSAGSATDMVGKSLLITTAKTSVIGSPDDITHSP